MNSVNLIGRLTADPEARTTASGTTVAAMRLAVARRARNGEDRGAVFIDITAWDKLGAVCAEHLAKGRQVAISGRLELDEWTGPDGSKRQRHHVVAVAVDFVGAKREEAEAPRRGAPAGAPAPLPQGARAGGRRRVPRPQALSPRPTALPSRASSSRTARAFW